MERCTQVPFNSDGIINTHNGWENVVYISLNVLTHAWQEEKQLNVCIEASNRCPDITDTKWSTNVCLTNHTVKCNS